MVAHLQSSKTAIALRGANPDNERLANEDPGGTAREEVSGLT
jgi:hypothetical protein